MPIDVLEKPPATGCYSLVDGFINGYIIWSQEQFWKMSRDVQRDTILQAKFIAERDPKELNFEDFINKIYDYESVRGL